MYVCFVVKTPLISILNEDHLVTVKLGYNELGYYELSFKANKYESLVGF